MRESEWLKVVGWIGSVWPHTPIEPKTASAWYPFVADLTADEVQAAVTRLALDASLRYVPTIGQIRAAASPPRREWTDALGELRQTIQAAGGSYADPIPTFDDPALNAVVADYGWRSICQLRVEDSAVRAQWREAYKGAQNTLVQKAATELVAQLTARSLPALEAGSDS